MFGEMFAQMSKHVSGKFTNWQDLPMAGREYMAAEKTPGLGVSISESST